MKVQEHYFRHEWGRMVAALTRAFGVQHLALAEDVVQEAFCRAMETWPYRGVPENPQAWLMTTAKNLALDVLRRQRTAQKFAPELEQHLRSEWTLLPVVEESLSPNAIKDDLLRMMFSCCQPKIAPESQVALILNILCGFGVDEVAAALVGGYAAAEKRIGRGKKALATSGKLFALTSPLEFANRLPSVHRALYLLFNEGYHGASASNVVRSELCREAMRLVAVLLDHPLGATPAGFALGALMCFNAARLPARLDAAGDLQKLADQDRSKWDEPLIAEGVQLLGASASGNELSEYHIEAAIAALHSTAPNEKETDWNTIATLYDRLFALQPSPIVALNRAIALGQVAGPEVALSEIEGMADRERLAKYPFYYAALGELELERGCGDQAHIAFKKAYSMARNPTEKAFLSARMRRCERAT